MLGVHVPPKKVDLHFHYGCWLEHNSFILEPGV
jgi:hypothetical protein